MKRFFALLLVLTMLFSLAACGSKTPETTEEPETTTEPETSTEPETTTEEPDTTTEPETTTEEPETTAEPETTVEPETTEESKDTDDVVDNAKDSILGNREGNKYEVPSMGFGLELPDYWNIFNEEELAALIGIAIDQFNNDNLTEMLENSASILEFVAASPAGSSITIAREYLPDYIDADTYFDVASPVLVRDLRNSGYENLTYEIATVSFLGEEQACMNLQGTVNGIDVYQTLVVIMSDGYVSLVTLTGTSPEQGTELLDYFYPV
ncbi:MAG: hypothetical protein IJ453_05780 [Oscillospiraceae bacterium]|nr:hypothetical protein [Oscillospiraceae bacterium]